MINSSAPAMCAREDAAPGDWSDADGIRRAVSHGPGTLRDWQQGLSEHGRIDRAYRRAIAGDVAAVHRSGTWGEVVLGGTPPLRPVA
jgi:hypothetical protein